MNTGDVIKMLRKNSGMTQDELARRLGLNKSSIQKYENGMVQNLKLRTIRDLCKIFRAPPWYFIFPERSLDENEEHLNELKNQANFLLQTYTQLSQEGRARLFLYLEDIMQIDRYCNHDLNIYELELQLLKKTLKHYER